MNTKTLISLVFVVSLFCELTPAQVSQNYRRLVPGGPFRAPALWTPFDPSAPIPLVGPGGSNDHAIFDLGFNLFNTYTILDVVGTNDQLIVDNDSVRLEITDYETISTGAQNEPSIGVGSDAGDIGILTLSGEPGAELRSYATSLGFHGTGSVIVDSPDLNWFNSEAIYVGTFGNATLRVQGGAVTSHGTIIGSREGAKGVLRVVGPDSSWREISTNISQMTVGSSGEGLLSIQDGGRVNVENRNVLIGLFEQGVATVNVSGDGSFFSVEDDMIIGNLGVANMEIDGGAVHCNAANIADDDISYADVNVSGTESTWVVNSDLRVGVDGFATVNVSDESFLNSGPSSIGHNNGIGEVTVDNANWFTAGNLNVGFFGDGDLTVTNGGFVWNIGNAMVGRQTGGSGFVRVSDGGIWDATQMIGIGGDVVGNFDNGGSGTVTIEQDGLVLARNGLAIFPDGQLILAVGGQLTAESISFIGGGSLVLGDGVLQVETFNGDLTQTNAVLDPGFATFDEHGSTFITGNYDIDDAGRLKIDISGPGAGTQYDTVLVNGSVCLGGRLNVNLVDGFIPDASQTFIVLTTQSSPIIGFMQNIGDNQRLETEDGTGSFLVRYGVTSSNPSQIVLSDFQLNFVPGDLNGDGVVNLLDVEPFTDTIASGKFDAAADINQDGQVNLLDVCPFVQLLAG